MNTDVLCIHAVSGCRLLDPGIGDLKFVVQAGTRLRQPVLNKLTKDVVPRCPQTSAPQPTALQKPSADGVRSQFRDSSLANKLNAKLTQVFVLHG